VLVLVLVLIAVVRAVTAWAVRPTPTSDGAHEDGDARSRAIARFEQLKGQLRDTSARLRRRASDNESPPAIASPMIVPAPKCDRDTVDSYVEGFDLRSVAKFATRFFGCLVAAFAVGAIVLWTLASVVGLVSDVEHFMRSIGFTGFSFLSVQLILEVALVALVFGALMVALTVLAAALCNVLAQRHGGVRMFVSDGTAVRAADASLAKARAGTKEPARNGADASTRQVSSNGSGSLVRVPARAASHRTRDGRRAS
jgi:hypothetical protein